MQRGVRDGEDAAEDQVRGQEGQDVACTVLPVGEAEVRAPQPAAGRALKLRLRRRRGKDGEQRGDDGPADEKVDQSADQSQASRRSSPTAWKKLA